MTTFITHDTFKECAEALSDKDLRQARVSARDLLKNPDGDLGMWDGHLGALCLYGMAVSYDWHQRGHPDMQVFHSFERHRKIHVKPRRSVIFPWWLTDPDLHNNHRSVLVFRDPGHYASLFHDVSPQPAMWWPPSKKPPPYTNPDEEEEF